MFGIMATLGRFYYELRQYTRQHQNIQELKSVINNQLHALEFGMYKSEAVINQLKSTLVLFDLQLKELDKSMKLHIKSEKIDGKVKKYISNERSQDTDIIHNTCRNKWI
jgi:hypothetical protein